MSFIYDVLGKPLGYIMYFCYNLLGNYGLSIIFFTLLTKVLMFPLSLISQKNSIIMVKMRPDLDDIKQRYYGNSTQIIKEQKALYKKEGYSTWKGLLPLFVQIPIVLGLINVIYNPLQHLVRLDPALIQSLLQKGATILGITVEELGSGAQLNIMNLIQTSPDLFAGMGGIEQIKAMNLDFLGMSLAQVPTLLSWSMLYPIFSGLSALALGIYQNKYNVLQNAQSTLSQWSMTIFLVIFSSVFAYFLPTGVGLYWIIGNLLSIPVLTLCNKIYSPKEYLDQMPHLAKPKLTKEEKKAARELKRKKRIRERNDRKRFAQAKDKHLVFYSESSGFYKYFAGFMDYILENSDYSIHYVTSDYHDQIFSNPEPRIEKYYIGPIALIKFMMLMDADMVVMTMPDLEKYHIKRSLVRKDIEYVYVDHGMTSFHLMLQENALDYFDTIFCYGPNHIAEIRAMEKVYNLPAKRLVKSGFPLLDSMLEAVEELGDTENEPKKILIAPSWQKDNILEYCLAETLKPLVNSGYQITVRPHPEFVKRFPDKMQQIIDQYQELDPKNLIFQTDFSANDTVYTADLVITDWSSIANEFSYATKKPSLFINTPMKITNPNWEKIDLVPLDLSLRDEIGISIDVDNLATLDSVVEELFTKYDWYRKHIAEVVKQNIYDIGYGNKSGGYYIIKALDHKVKQIELEFDSDEDTEISDFKSEKVYQAIESRLEQLSKQKNPDRTEVIKFLNEPLSDLTQSELKQGEFLLELLDNFPLACNKDDDQALMEGKHNER